MFYYVYSWSMSRFRMGESFREKKRDNIYGNTAECTNVIEPHQQCHKSSDVIRPLSRQTFGILE